MLKRKILAPGPQDTPYIKRVVFEADEPPTKKELSF